MTCPTNRARAATNNSCSHLAPSSKAELASAAALYDLTDLICNHILCPLVLAFGVPTNLINILVLTRKWMRSSTNVYLTAVAVADTLYLVLYFVRSLDNYPSLHLERHLWFQNTRAISGSACNLLSNVATWLTCTFTIERYVAVSNPMLGRKICTRRRARLITTAVIAAALGLTFPDFLFLVGCRSPAAANSTAPATYATRRTAAYHRMSNFGWIYLNQVLFVFAPLLVLCVANGLLIRSVVRARRERNVLMQAGSGDQPQQQQQAAQPQRASGGGEQQRITVMLIAVVLVFCILQLPSTASVVIIVLWKTRKVCFDRATLRRLQTMSLVANLMIMVNAATNFLLYSAFSLKFRRTFQRLLFEALHRAGYRRQAGRYRAGVDYPGGATVTGTPWLQGSRCSEVSRAATLTVAQRRAAAAAVREGGTARNGYLSLKTAARSPSGAKRTAGNDDKAPAVEKDEP